jgi:High-temperature-induced dauer-formation protein
VLLYYPLEHKTDPSQIGLVRMSAFVLQTLSAEQDFATSLNRPFEGHGSLPSSVRLANFNGTYADFMIIVPPLRAT